MGGIMAGLALTPLDQGFPGGSAVKNPPGVQESQIQSLGREDPLEKGMDTHSSILAWRIPGQKSLVGYSPWGCKESDKTDQLANQTRGPVSGNGAGNNMGETEALKTSSYP